MVFEAERPKHTWYVLLSEWLVGLQVSVARLWVVAEEPIRFPQRTFSRALEGVLRQVVALPTRAITEPFAHFASDRQSDSLCAILFHFPWRIAA